MENNSEESLEYLILNGYVEVAGIDSEAGDFLYSFTEEAKRKIPDLRRQMDEEFYRSIVYLWEQGFLDMDIDSDNPVVTLKEKALDLDALSSLPKPHKSVLANIMDAMNRLW